MEELVGPIVEVVLTLKEVTNLTFVNGLVFAAAKFSENQMETDIHEADTVVKFNTDLVWEAKKANIKRMRNSNIPIKLFLYKYIDEKHHEKLGYVVVNLRTAQYVPKGKPVIVKEELVKILGLGKEAKGCTPQICLSLSIRDKVPETEEVQIYENPNPTLNDLKIETYDGASTEPDVEIPAKQLPALSENADMNEMGDVRGNKIPLRRERSIGKDEVISLPIPGEPVLSPPLSSRSPRSKHSITSIVAEERQCYNVYEAKNSSGDLQPQKKCVEAYHKFVLKIRLESIVLFKVPQKFRFRFRHSRSDIFCTTYPEIHVGNANETIELCDVEAIFNFVETPAEFYKLLIAVPPMVSISTTLQNRPNIIANGLVKTHRLTPTDEENMYEIELIDVKSHEVIGKLSYAASLTDSGPQVIKDVTLKIKPEMAEEDLPPAIFGTVTEKIVDELEDWKERQKQLFQRDFTKKLEKEMAELKAEWMERRREQEEKLSQKIEQCKLLGNSLISVTEDVKQRNREFIEKEKNLEISKSEIELRYLKLLTDKNNEAEKMKNEYLASLSEKESRIAALEAEKTALADEVSGLRKENEELKALLKESEQEMEKNRRACLSQEQTATLLQDLKTMQEKMEAANNSKLFFKEQWGRAVREIHRIKSEYTKNIKVQLQYRKDELKKLGLEQLFLIEKNKNNLERDDMLEAKDFLGSDFESKTGMNDMDFLRNSKSNYEVFKTNMDIVKESNTYLLKFNQESEEKLKRLIDERDKLLCEQNCPIDDERIVRLNKEIRHLLDH